MEGKTVSRSDRECEPIPSRKFGLFDAMVLLAGAALSLAGGAYLLLLMDDTFGRLCVDVANNWEHAFENWPMFWRATHDDLRNSLWYGLQVAEMLLAGMTPAFFIVRLRRPRPPLRVLLRYAGTVAGLAMVFGLFWVAGLLAYLFPEKYSAETCVAGAVGGTVAVAWAVMTLIRRWETERGWIDCLGRLLGVTAIGAALVGQIVFRI